MTFYRDALSRDASLNQLVVLGGPYNGRSGGDLLSRDALAQLEPGLDPHRLTDALNGRPHMAAEVAAETGHRLAALVATLRRRATSAVTGITEGRRRYLEEWQQIDDVVLGGGLLLGGFGAAVVNAATTELAARNDVPPTRLSLAAHAAVLGLIGAARTAGRTDGMSLVLDGGQTTIKPALAKVAGGMLRRLQPLPPIPVAGVAGDDLVRMISGTVNRVMQDHRGLRPVVACSIAAYVRDGRPIRDDASPYEALADAPPAVLRQLRLIHDGSAAWRGTGRTTSSAVIVMGTWLGIGMGPHSGTDLAPLRDDFVVE